MNTADLKRGLDTCTYCPKLCTHACPVSREEGREAVTPWGLVTLANLSHKKMIPFSEEVAANLYRCLDCLGCWSACELENNVSDLLHAFRVRAFEEDKAPIALYSFSHRFREKNNPYKLDLSQRVAQLVKGVRVDGTRHSVYFAGCSSLAHEPEGVTAWQDLHAKLKLPCPSVFQDPVQCCGYPLYAAGDMAQFKDIAEIQRHALKDARLIVSPMPECIYTLKTLYPKVGVRLTARMVHTSQYLLETLARVNFTVREVLRQGSGQGSREPVLYHDSCVLGRYLGCYDEPRDLMTQYLGCEVKEFSLHHDRSSCCGGMLPFAVLERKTAVGIAKERLREVKRRGVRRIVTASPLCAAHLKKGGLSIDVTDLLVYCESMIEGSK